MSKNKEDALCRLKVGYERLSKRSNWCRHKLRMLSGNGIQQYCAVGALQYVRGKEGLKMAENLLDREAIQLGSTSIVALNDFGTNSYSKVRPAYRRAIRKLEEKVASS